MRRSRFTEAQMLAVLAESEAGAGTDELGRRHGISRNTFYNWRRSSAAMDNDTPEDRQKNRRVELIKL